MRSGRVRRLVEEKTQKKKKKEKCKESQESEMNGCQMGKEEKEKRIRKMLGFENVDGLACLGSV